MIEKAEPSAPHGMAFTTTKTLFVVSIVIGVFSSFIGEFRFADFDSRVAIVVLCSVLYGQGLSHIEKDIRNFKSTKKIDVLVFNEQVKSVSTAFSNLSIAIIISVLIVNNIGISDIPIMPHIVILAIALYLFFTSRSVLRYIKDLDQCEI